VRPFYVLFWDASNVDDQIMTLSTSLPESIAFLPVAISQDFKKYEA